MRVKKFHEIFEAERAAISKRREKYDRQPIALEDEGHLRDGTPIKRPTQDSNVIGLALSGGGIRSSAFCLGALQALDHYSLIEKIDYLSTVSGGGYIGTSMTAAMTAGNDGKFPFSSHLRESEPAAIQHIRDHSNYLFPEGSLNIFSNLVVYLRGIVANGILLLPWLLLAAAATIWWKPTVEALKKPNLATLFAALLFIVLLALWALWRSTGWGQKSDVGIGAQILAFFSVAILLFAFVELQPWLLSRMFEAKTVAKLFANASSWLKGVTAFLASIGIIVGAIGRFLADLLKRATDKPGFTALATRIAIRLAMYLGGAAVPLVLWLAYLYLCFWGIEDPGVPGNNAPIWLTTIAHQFGDEGIGRFYLFSGLALLAISFLLEPNANSLHRLYRDRLSKAFLFDPRNRVAQRALLRVKREIGAESYAPLRNSDLLPLDGLRISELRTELAPYQLINTAINIEGSKYANRRGRNADFFVFSPLFVGSQPTGYVDTKQMEEKISGLTLGTAMAVSGAAASSNMGSATIKPLVPTLAILNIRLGYWMRNPSAVVGALKEARIWRLFDGLYFLKELFGLLTEDSATVYLTDGGHIENLAIYELLRRRCKLIIAVDAEADPDMSFRSLVTLERYARIDFGIRIDLPWAEIRDASRAASTEILKSGGLPPNKAPHGPHCALGTIYYPRTPSNEEENRHTGLLLYVKSSLTGDEDDYIVDYKRRNPTFPHETTADQLFSEEQFEAYRALGFHAVHSAFKPADKVSMDPIPIAWRGKASTIPLEKRMLRILS
jgi:predicted acylesterase/phospholipase RssA